LAKSRRPAGASRASEGALEVATLSGPSLPSSTAYSSFVPTTISGRASPVMSPTAGVSTIAP
jgi:hypothetical protein